MRVIYLFIMKIILKYSDKKEKTRNTLVNTKRPLCSAHAGRPICTFRQQGTLVTDIVTDVLIRCPIIAQRSKGTHCFHSVVGLSGCSSGKTTDTGHTAIY